MRTKGTTGRLWAIALALCVALLAALAPAASAAVSPAAKERARALGLDVREELGEDVTLGSSRADRGLFRVALDDGTVVATHGPDPIESVHGHGSQMNPGDPERTPICADGHSIHVLYGRPAGGVDRYGMVVERFRSAVRRMNHVLHEEAMASGARAADYRVRCSGGGQIRVDAFTGPTSGADSFTAVVEAARSAGFTDPTTNYLIFYDTPAVQYCGIGGLWTDERLAVDNKSNQGGQYGITHSSCWDGSTPMHENGHNMGAVQPSAPDSTGSGGHCNDEIDVMCYSPDGGNANQLGTVTDCADAEHFDCNFDTYFDAAPEEGEWLASHWNIGSELNRFVTFGVGSNDDFANRRVVELMGEDVTSDGSNVAATKEAGEPAHAGDDGGASVWWTWTAPHSAQVTIDTVGSGFDTVLGVYTGNAVGGLTSVASNDDAAGNAPQSAVSFNATAGTAYRIAVDGARSGGVPATGAIKLRVAQPAPPPANDDLADAQELTGSFVPRTGDRNTGATKEAGEPAHASNAGGASVWYRWTAPSTGDVEIATAGSSVDTLLAVYTGTTVDALGPAVAANDDSGIGMSRQSRVTFTAAKGTTYRIAVDSYNAQKGRIQLQLVQRPANDDFSQAVTLTGVDDTRTGDTNRGATKQAAEPSHAGEAGGASVWYRWTAAQSGPTTVDTAGSGFDTLLGVYTGNAVSGLTTVGANDDGPLGTSSSVTFYAVAGTTYSVAVDGFRADNGDVRVHVGQIPDTTAPAIASFSPAANAIGVATRPAIAVTFSEPMARPAAQAAFSLRRASGGGAVGGSFTWSANTMVFRPATPLAYGTAYTARVGAGAVDRGGNPVATRAWSFRTLRSVSAVPFAGKVLRGKRTRGGFAASLGADDTKFLLVRSTTRSPRRVVWTARFRGVPSGLRTLSLAYKGRSSRKCMRSLAVRNAATGRWVGVGTLSAGPSQVLTGITLGGRLSDFVSGGEVVVRATCVRTARRTFSLGSNLLRLSYTAP